jgi:hypothetical protein
MRRLPPEQQLMQKVVNDAKLRVEKYYYAKTPGCVSGRCKGEVYAVLSWRSEIAGALMSVTPSQKRRSVTP